MRHACLARAVRTKPPSALHGLDVQFPLERACLDTFTNLDEVSESFESLYVYKCRKSAIKTLFENIHQITEVMTLV